MEKIGDILNTGRWTGMNDPVCGENTNVCKPYKVGLTFGVFDLPHIGHINLLRNAKDICDYLIVCVSSDEYSEVKKEKTPIMPLWERKEIVGAIRYVDQVEEQSLSFTKAEAVKQYKPDVLIVGDDWNKDTYTGEGLGVPVVYLPYTKHISSTKLRSRLNL